MFFDTENYYSLVFIKQKSSHKTICLFIYLYFAIDFKMLVFDCFFFTCDFDSESCDGVRRTNELALNTGYQRRTREIADWARNKRRRYIRREDLLAYLAGKSSPSSGMIHVTRVSPQHLYANTQQSKPLHSQHNNIVGPGSPTATHHHHQVQPHTEHHHLHGSATFVSSMDSDLHTFKEALAKRSR